MPEAADTDFVGSGGAVSALHVGVGCNRFLTDRALVTLWILLRVLVKVGNHTACDVVPTVGVVNAAEPEREVGAIEATALGFLVRDVGAIINGAPEESGVPADGTEASAAGLVVVGDFASAELQCCCVVWLMSSAGPDEVIVAFEATADFLLVANGIARGRRAFQTGVQSDRASA